MSPILNNAAMTNFGNKTNRPKKGDERPDWPEDYRIYISFISAFFGA
jgi:hypothetical protein